MRRTLVLAVVLAVAGCTGSTDPPAPAPAPSPPGSATGAGGSAACDQPAPGPVDPAAVLVPGPINGLPATDAVGEPLTITATVLEPGCAPAAGAVAEVWHTDARGLYGPGGGSDQCCYYGGTVTADANGRFRLDTIRPAQYPQAGAPPAHIHFEFRHPSGGLGTEIVFDAGAAPPGQIVPATVIPVELTRSGDAWTGTTAFVLEP